MSSTPQELEGREQKQITDIIMMITPSMFGFNEQTAYDDQSGTPDNLFQHREPNASEAIIRDRALTEFVEMVNQLRDEGIKVVVLDNRTNEAGDYAATPDAVFPNNWISFHDSKIVLYPMKAKNRREERQLNRAMEVLAEAGIVLQKPVVDLTELEKEGSFVEGTGSLVLDRQNALAFASLSQRTTVDGVNHFGEATGYEPVFFRANDAQGNEIYHTNVVMSVGEQFAVVCFEAIPEDKDKQAVETKLIENGKEVIAITLEQMSQMCGNILQVNSAEGQKIVMSKTAYNGFTPEQRAIMEQYGKLVVVEIDQIERTGGGSARCMMAEVFV